MITLPTAWQAVRDLPRRRLVVNKADKYSSHPEIDHDSVIRAEQELLEAADVVLYVNRDLMDEDLPVAGDRAVFLDHAVDLDHFVRRARSELPADLAAIPEPRVGFFGSLDDYRIDMDLIERVAREIPDAHVVLVGAATSSMKRFEALDNVHWLGPKPYEEVPAYGSGFDVALMPYLRNEWTRHINPIKSREYLALGMPVVTTDGVPQLQPFADVLLIAADSDDFVAKVRAALQGDSPGLPRTTAGGGGRLLLGRPGRAADAAGRIPCLLTMCGIVGIRRFDGETVDEQLLRQMADQLVHRGPDDSGVWVDGSIGFGHRRLSIIDVGGSPQPMASADGRHHITFNGEIFNYRDLRGRVCATPSAPTATPR